MRHEGVFIKSFRTIYKAAKTEKSANPTVNQGVEVEKRSSNFLPTQTPKRMMPPIWKAMPEYFM